MVMNRKTQICQETFDEVHDAFIHIPGRARSGVYIKETGEKLIFRHSDFLPKVAELIHSFIIAILVIYLRSK